MDLAYANEKRPDKVESILLAQLTCQCVLGLCILARGFSNGGKEQMAAIWEPAHPVEFGDGWNSLEGVLPRLQRNVVWVILRKEELGSLDLTKGRFDN